MDLIHMVEFLDECDRRELMSPEQSYYTDTIKVINTDSNTDTDANTFTNTDQYQYQYKY